MTFFIPKPLLPLQTEDGVTRSDQNYLWSCLAFNCFHFGCHDEPYCQRHFQDYFLNLVTQKFGATVFTDGLQHAMKLPYQDFEDQRSGETLGVLQKVRTDTEKFINYFINILFPV